MFDPSEGSPDRHFPHYSGQAGVHIALKSGGTLVDGIQQHLGGCAHQNTILSCVMYIGSLPGGAIGVLCTMRPHAQPFSEREEIIPAPDISSVREASHHQQDFSGTVLPPLATFHLQ